MVSLEPGGAEPPLHEVFTPVFCAFSHFIIVMALMTPQCRLKLLRLKEAHTEGVRTRIACRKIVCIHVLICFADSDQ